MPDSTFPKTCRVLRGVDFDRVYARKTSVADDVLIVYGGENELPHARLGLSVSRRIGKATVRNRWKRVIREAFRLVRHELPAGVDFVITPRASAEPTLAAVKRSLPGLAERVRRKLVRSRG